MMEGDPAQLLDADRCLLQDSALLSLSSPDAAGLLDRRSNISGWYQYWFSLRGSQLLYFERGQSGRRGLLVGTISLFRHKLTIVNSIKRRREFEVTDVNGKVHVLRTGSDAELHWWVQLFGEARKKIPPAQPIDRTGSAISPSHAKKSSRDEMPSTVIDSHLKVDHILCIVHGIGVSSDVLAGNTRQLQENFAEIMAKVFPDIEFRIELLVIHWREALTNLDVHRKLQAVVPIAPVDDDANPLRQFMVHRIVDYVYYTHERYRRHILREVASQLNAQMDSFRRRRPDFDGKISVLGHSLGAALCYDLMCRKVHDDQVLLEAEGMRLNFDAANLFCVGNPLGTFLGLDPTIGLGSDMLKLPFRIYNIFKYHDPIATRLEPHVDLANVDVRPVTVPCWFNMGLRESTAQWLGTLWPGGQKKKGAEVVEPNGANSVGQVGTLPGDVENGVAGDRVGVDSAEPAFGWSASTGSSVETSSDMVSLRRSPGNSKGQFGSGLISEDSLARSDGNRWAGAKEAGRVEGGDVRMDYALQASSTMEEVSTSWSALKAHTEYWGNRDAMLLMVSCMMKSTFGLTDTGGKDEAVSATEWRIVDEDILKKSGGRGGFSEDREGEEHGDEEGDEVLLEDSVRLVVERLVDEAVATHELMKLHPQVKMRSGGITTRSPDGSKTEIGTEGAGSASASGSGSGGSGWASYLPGGWFGGEGRAKQRAEKDASA